MIKLSISNIAWEAGEDERVCEFLQSRGIGGLEIAPTRIFPTQPYTWLEEAAAYAERLKERYGLEISSMQSIWFGREEKLFGTRQERESLLLYTKQAIDFAEAAGCGNLVFGSPKNRVIPIDETGQPDREQRQLAVEFFSRLGEYAAAHGTCLSLEPNPVIYQTNFITRTQEAVELVKEVNQEGFRVNVDLGTMISNEEAVSELEPVLEWVRHIHISEPWLARIQNRSIHNELAELLAERDYPYYVSVEMKKTDETEQVFETMDYVRGLFEPERADKREL